MIEVEKRGLLTEDAYVSLRQRLQEGATFVGEDNKHVEYWIYNDKLLKLIKNTSQKKTVLSLKKKEIGVGNAYEELEVDMAEGSFNTLKDIISSITVPDQVIAGTQKRENYKIGDVEIAMKWSEDWKYHIEMECLVESESEESHAVDKIDDLAKTLGITLMTVAEEKEFIEKVRQSKK